MKEETKEKLKKVFYEKFVREIPKMGGAIFNNEAWPVSVWGWIERTLNQQGNEIKEIINSSRSSNAQKLTEIEHIVNE